MKNIKERLCKKLVVPVSSPAKRTRAQCKKIRNQIVETISKELNKKTKKKANVKVKDIRKNEDSITLSTKQNSRHASNSVKSHYSFNYSEGLNVVLDISSPSRDQIINNNYEKSIVSPVLKKSNYYFKLEKMLDDNKSNFDRNDYYQIKYLLKIKNFIIKDNNPLLGHTNIKQSFRQRLLLWICNLCCEFNFERITYYMTINLIDLFMSKTFDCQTKQLQLLGIVSLIISSKFNEVDSHKMSIYSEKSNNTFSFIEIKNMEIYLLKTLEYNIHYPNLFEILFYIINKWDNFIQGISVYQIKHNINPTFITGNPNKKMFYTLIQILDLAILDSRYLKLNPFKLSAAFIFCILLYFSESKKPNILQDFLNNSRSSHETNLVLRLFLEYIQQNFMIKFHSLSNSFNYIGSFIDFYLSNSKKSFDNHNFNKILILQTPYSNREKINTFFDKLDYKK